MVALTWVMLGLCATLIAANSPMENNGLFEGDMILTDDQKRDFENGEANYQIPLAATKINLWPTTIPYSMESSISSSSKAMSAINAAIADYQKLTCLRFVRRTNEPGYLHFYKGGGCSSPVGYFRRANRISLASGCWYKGVVMHEIAHSLGFYHEQSRPDRDNHVEIVWANIAQGMDYNFRKQSSSNIDSMSSPYDFESIMHYGKTAFGSGKVTIRTKDASKQNVIGNRRGFSTYDAQQMNSLYKCSGGGGTQAPVTTAAPGCTDKYVNDCPRWKQSGYCTKSGYVNWMATNCAKTCGKCGSVVTTQAPTIAPTTAPACKDVHARYCPGWKQKGYCTMAQYKSYMKRNCAQTCGYCGGVITQAPTTQAPTQPPTTQAPTQPPTTAPACVDKYVTNCPGWKNAGYCTSAKYQAWMSRNCAKTCGKCGGGAVTTQAPVVTTQGPVVTQAPGSCGKPEVSQARVISGINANRGSWPWQILMLYNGRTMCGGSLVAPQWVVTAAHCVSGRESQARSFKVRVGEHITSTTSDGQHTDVVVEKIISHPSYSRSTINNDIALMKLASPVRFTKYVKPVCLPSQDQAVPVGTQCFITGWGKIQHPGNMHHTLQQGKMPVVSNTVCKNLNTKNMRIPITDQMVCAGHGGTTTVSGCHGDSGGPFVCQTGANGGWVLHGAVSWGSGRCDATQGYTVFARVAKFKSWIDQQMAGN